MKKLIFSLMALFALKSAHAQLLVSDFEAWHTYNVGLPAVAFPMPNGWSSSDSIYGTAGILAGQLSGFAPGLAKETPGNGGSGTALKVLTAAQPALGTFLPAGVYPTFASNGKLSLDLATLDFNISGGYPLEYIPYSVSMYVKNNVVSGDTTQITIESIDDGDALNVQVAYKDTILFDNISSYTKLTLKLDTIDPNATPTHFRVSISSSSDNSDTSMVGTYIVVDDIQINFPNGLHQSIYENKIAQVYPTIANNQLFVNFVKPLNENLTIDIFDLNGKVILSTSLFQTENKIDISNLANGAYLFAIHNNNGAVRQSSKFVKQ